MAPRAAGAAAIPLPTTLEGASVEVSDGSRTLNASGTQLLTIQGTGLWTFYNGNTTSSVTRSLKDIPIGYDPNWQGGLIGGETGSSAVSDHVVSYVANGQSLPATDKPTLTLTFRHVPVTSRPGTCPAAAVPHCPPPRDRVDIPSGVT